MEQHIVGKPLQRIDAWAKATGRAEFGADVHLPDMVYCKGVYTEHAHAKLLAVHTEAAERAPRRPSAWASGPTSWKSSSRSRAASSIPSARTRRAPPRR